MKNFAVVAGIVFVLGSFAVASEPVKVCDAKGCRIVEVPKAVAGQVVREVRQVSQAPASVVKKVRSNRPVRSFLRKVVGR